MQQHVHCHAVLYLVSHWCEHLKVILVLILSVEAKWKKSIRYMAKVELATYLNSVSNTTHGILHHSCWALVFNIWISKSIASSSIEVLNGIVRQRVKSAKQISYSPPLHTKHSQDWRICSLHRMSVHYTYASDLDWNLDHRLLQIFKTISA